MSDVKVFYAKKLKNKTRYVWKMSQFSKILTNQFGYDVIRFRNDSQSGKTLTLFHKLKETYIYIDSNWYDWPGGLIWKDLPKRCTVIQVSDPEVIDYLIRLPQIVALQIPTSP